MATMPKEPLAGVEKPYHLYHAEAHVLSGNLKHPVDQPIEHHARVVLKNRRSDHIMEKVEETSLEGLISFKAGHTRVSGTQLKNKKDLWGNDHSGWVTLSTSVIEGLNVFEVVTADRVVAQVSTEHASRKGDDSDRVPKVTFLGTRFENLRVGGFPVQVELDFGICGERPKDDRSYLQHADFLDRVRRQLDDIAGAKGIPGELEKQYDARIAYIDDLKKRANGRAKGERNGYPKLQCSLVKSIGPIPIPGVRTFGNIIFIPDFGTVALAEIEVGITSGKDVPEEIRTSSPADPGDSNYFTLNMLNMHLGCIAGGTITGASVTANGSHGPGH
jgi:hypothetical protein